jgi:hypothetical protein
MEEIRCSVCGSLLNPDDRFCPNCGMPVEVPAADAEPIIEPVVEAVTEPDIQLTEAVTEPDIQLTEAVTEPDIQLTEQATEAAVEQVEESAGEPLGYEQETSVLSGNPYSVYNATYQEMPMDSTNYQGGYPQNTGVYIQPTDEPKKNSGKGLGIAAMIVGILSILCCPGGSVLGLVGIILAIVCMAKKKGKPFSIIGLITSILGFVIGILILVSVLTPQMSALGNAMNDMGLDMSDYIDSSDSSSYSGSNSLNYANQVMIDGDIYTLPATLDSLGLSVDASETEALDTIANGLENGEFEFVLLNSENGSTFWGYVENATSKTVYSLDELEVTGLNVDNYSSECTVDSVMVYGGITLNMSRSEVEDSIGLADRIDSNGYEVYSSTDGDTVLRIGYDSSDYVEELDVTYYY